ncbi:hypothetical protein CHLRE_05g242501v5 [Chlamydomonas reinhardtii]|uniref:Uncharacterized protein n=1 Tax=Chlamydomonas reinhardtii TaxID=3055 RepID=A0A2K3DSF2_CHLRE|nr:uncharacterized protein CHLRE_05g242501v5 [Chlamydomonas reinhardtii]PNW83463.1 hypothetical protein CHLRE_05g242501v5 [Chlamydomonas reinhardtii]
MAKSCNSLWKYDEATPPPTPLESADMEAFCFPDGHPPPPSAASSPHRQLTLPAGTGAAFGPPHPLRIATFSYPQHAEPAFARRGSAGSSSGTDLGGATLG